MHSSKITRKMHNSIQFLHKKGTIDTLMDNSALCMKRAVTLRNFLKYDDLGDLFFICTIFFSIISPKITILDILFVKMDSLTLTGYKKRYYNKDLNQN